MPLEIERKFLVFPDRLPDLAEGERYEQGYLSLDPEVRFRIHGDQVTLAVKKVISTGRRLEFEFPRAGVDREEIASLKSIALWPPLVKIRYRLAYEGLVWEVDVYQDLNKGLVTADVEIPGEDYAIKFPDWVDPNSDITGDGRYANVNLTRCPYAT
ncbi:adenylate cyclase [bacterium]|nr:adenylate cyclase [bacterium]